MEILAYMWLAPMEKCLELQQRGIPVFAARYEELNRAPRDVLTQMFAFSGLPTSAVGKLDAVLEQDSQAGTALSREKGSTLQPQQWDEHLQSLHRLIRESSQQVTSDTIIPGTWFPATAAEKPEP